MSIFRALEISSQGMSAQRERVTLATSNLANAETTRGPDGGPYRRLDPVFEATVNDDGSAGVRVAEVVADPGEGKLTYMPGHPDADASGFVRLAPGFSDAGIAPATIAAGDGVGSAERTFQIEVIDATQPIDIIFRNLQRRIGQLLRAMR